MTPDNSATWLTAPCPIWCARAHEQADHPEDRYHRSEPSYVAALAAVERTVPVLDALTATDLLVRVGQYIDDPIAWVAIEAAEDPEPRLVLTLESARLLAWALQEQLRRHDVRIVRIERP